MDFATLWDPAALTADWSLAGPDLASDAGLQTAVIISLMTDREAQPDDDLPADGDRRGWWGDRVRATGDTTPEDDRIGSRLWLLTRAKATAETASRARAYCLEALQWLLDDAVASTVEVTTAWLSREILTILIEIDRGQATARRFDLAWSATVPGVVSTGPLAAITPLPPL